MNSTLTAGSIITDAAHKIGVTLESFSVRDDGDQYSESRLEHDECGEVLCTLEHGDSLALIVRVAASHVCGDEVTDRHGLDAFTLEG